MRMFDDRCTNYDKPAAAYLIHRPATSNIIKFSGKECVVCGKAERLDGPTYIKKYGRFVCSSSCYEKFKTNNKKKIINKQDGEFVLRQLFKRRMAMEEVKNLQIEIAKLSKEMAEKKIQFACFNNQYHWFRLESFADIGYDDLFKVSRPTFEENEINPEYAKRYYNFVSLIEGYEIEIEQIERHLTSGNCIKYEWV